MAKIEWGISIMVFIHWTEKEIRDVEEAELENNASIISPQKFWKVSEKKRLPPTSYDTSNQVLLNYALFLKTLFGTKAPHKRGVESVQAGLLNMSDQEENVGGGLSGACFLGSTRR